jgi:effector-binding domain-containing protein
MGYDIQIESEQGRHLAVRRFDATPEEMGAQMGAAFGGVATYLRRIGVPVSGPAMSCYEMEGDDFHVASGFVVTGPFEEGDGVEHLQLPVREVVTTTHVGPYEKLGEAYDALKEWARGEGRAVDEDTMMWEEYLDGPQTPPEQTRTVVHWPLRPATATGTFGLGG